MAPQLVGRVEEMARLGRALERAMAGRGGAVLVAGEPGVGKTRVARETAELARGRGFLVLEARGYALEANLAYGLVLEALNAHLRALDERTRARLLGDSRELARLFGGGRLGEGELEKVQLFDAVARLLARLAAERPLLLWLDDLHWADAASLELLHFAARHLEAARFLLLGTLRAVDDIPGYGATAAARTRMAAPEVLRIPMVILPLHTRL